MIHHRLIQRVFLLACLVVSGILIPTLSAQDSPEPTVTELEQALTSAKDSSSSARQRLGVRRVVRDAEKLLEEKGDSPERWPVLEFIFRARQQLIALDDDSEYREALIDTCRELVKAPDAFAGLRLEADLLLSQTEQAKNGASAEERAQALLPFVNRYVDTPAGAKAMRTALVMALELGDSRLVNDLRDIIAEHFSGDLEMIAFLRDQLGGQVFSVPFVGHYKRSDGKTVRFPMDLLGHSAMVIFWSKDNENVLQYLADMAAAAKLDKERVDGRLEIISINLDELPDAGESIIRGVGADWQCLHLPNGRDNPIYKAYARTDPLNLRIAPTGQAAMVMPGSRRKRPPEKTEKITELLKLVKPAEDLKNYTESFRRATIRSWSQDDYALNLSALMTGDFLIFDPEGGMDPALPPELKATAIAGEAQTLTRGPDSVPEETLSAIQSCLIAPPLRYHSTVAEIRDGYLRMAELCRQAIADYPYAPDLWVVRNRLMIALIGLWKTDFKLEYFEAAVAEARLAMDVGYPPGTDLIARFCLARQALRDPEVNPGEVIDGLIAEYGRESTPGPAFAVACLLALDVADEKRFQDYRKLILEGHTESAMMWLFSSFLVDRYHKYWLFQIPFSAGWTFDRRLKHEMQKGDAEETHRMLQTELPTMDDKVFRIPEDLRAEYTAIFFAQPSPWKGRDRDDPKPPSPKSMMNQFPNFALSRPDVDTMVAILGEEDEATIRENIQINGSEEQLDAPILQVPGGLDHPLVHRLGLQSNDGGVALINKQGRILSTRSGVSFAQVHTSLQNIVIRQDEIAVNEALKRGDVEAAKKQILSLAPPYDPEAVDDRGRKLKKPEYKLDHLRARTAVYMALNEWDLALADAEEIYSREFKQASAMSIRTDELDKAEALRDKIKAHRDTMGQR